MKKLFLRGWIMLSLLIVVAPLQASALLAAPNTPPCMETLSTQSLAASSSLTQCIPRDPPVVLPPPPPPICGERTWDVKDLAKKILACRSRIDFQTTSQRTAFEQVARTGKQQRKGPGCDGAWVPISAGLLRTLLATTDKYVIIVGSLAYDHDCYKGYHPKGMAIDINGVWLQRSNGTWAKTNYGKGRNIVAADFRTSLLKNFYTDLSKQLIAQTTTSTRKGHGALGQYSCFSSPKPAVASGVIKVSDTCNHIHMDVR